MLKRSVIPFAVLSLLAAALAPRPLHGQPAPAWIPPPAPAPPVTLWRFLGIPQGFQRIADARLNRNGNFPGLERKPPLKPIAHPDNLLSNNPAIKKAAEIKMQEDLAKQKIKAIKYLAKLGCDKCYGGVKEALMAALDDCTEQVRYEAAKAVGEAAVQHCNVCSRQCCCDEELTKKLAQIVYELDDKGCPLEPSERVRDAAKEALQACCPNVGPPGYVPEEVAPPVIPQTPEVPKERGPETPRDVAPEVPPPPGQNGVAPRLDAGPAPITPPPPSVRPAPLPNESTGLFLRSRADRMASTARVRRVVQPNVSGPVRPVAQAAPQRPVARTPIQSTPVAIQQPLARITVSDQARLQSAEENAGTATVGDTETDRPSNGIRIRVTDASVAEPSQPSSESTSTPAGSAASFVRIRDSAGTLQLTSVTEPVSESGFGDAPAAARAPANSSRRNAAMVTDLPSGQTRSHFPASTAAAPVATAGEVFRSVQSIQPQSTTTKGQGKVTDIDSRTGNVRLSFPADQVPAAGTLVKVYHQFLLGEECVGAVEVTSVAKGTVLARPVGNLNLAKVSVNDAAGFQTTTQSSLGTQGTVRR